MSNQESTKKKGLTKKRRTKGLGVKRHRNGPRNPKVLARAKALNAALYAGQYALVRGLRTVPPTLRATGAVAPSQPLYYQQD